MVDLEEQQATAQQEPETSSQGNTRLTASDQLVLFWSTPTWLVTLQSVGYSGNRPMVWVLAQRNHGDSLANLKQRSQEVVQYFI